MGHIFSSSGISPDLRMMEAITKMVESSNVSELKGFLGMVNQLGEFILQLAERDKPLRDLKSQSPTVHVMVTQTDGKGRNGKMGNCYKG